jgi:hypothetical protein
MNIFEVIKSWFSKKEIKQRATPLSEDKSFQEWYDWGISCYLGEDKPMPTGKSIWFISYDDEALLKKYGPPKGNWGSMATGVDIENYSETIEWIDSKDIKTNKS